MIRLFSLIILLFVCSTSSTITAQDVRYYALSRTRKNGVDNRDVSGGQYISFISDICYESNKKGVGVGHGSLTRNKDYSNSQYTIYQGSSYWGNTAIFKFNADRSVLNVVLDNGDIYVYKRSAAPAGQETCSLIRKKSLSSSNNTDSFVVGIPQPVYPVDPYSSHTMQGYGAGSNDGSTSNNSTHQPTRHQCGLCGGTGEVIDETSRASFGNTKYCDKCKKTVKDSHYHKTCPSCKGKGWW